MSAHVQVFGRRDDEAIPAHRRQASEKRQGTKSREVGHRRCSGRYGDFAAGSGLRRLDRSGCDGRVSATRRRVRRYERAFWASRDKIGGATAGESSTPMRAWALPAESRPEWRSSLRSTKELRSNRRGSRYSVRSGFRAIHEARK
jgi:hypothetical protein